MLACGVPLQPVHAQHVHKPQELSCFLFNPYAIRCPSLAYYLGHFRAVGVVLLGRASGSGY